MRTLVERTSRLVLLVKLNGSNQNANGSVREYLPEGMDLSHVSDEQLPSIEYSLNHRPRKVLGFRTPFEVFCELKLNNLTGVALQA